MLDINISTTTTTTIIIIIIYFFKYFFCYYYHYLYYYYCYQHHYYDQLLPQAPPNLEEDHEDELGCHHVPVLLCVLVLLRGPWRVPVVKVTGVVMGFYFILFSCDGGKFFFLASVARLGASQIGFINKIFNIILFFSDGDTIFLILLFMLKLTV